MRILHSIRPLAFCLALAACVTSGTAEYVSIEAVGVPRLFKYAASSGTLPTVIYGNPSAVPKAAFDQAVISAMGEHVWGQKSNFTLSSPALARDGYRVVIVFSGARHFGGKAACSDIDPAALAPVAGRSDRSSWR